MPRQGAAFALACVVALLAPGTAGAQGSDPEYPPEFLALLPRWIAEVEALAQPDAREKAWWPEAESFLLKAKAAQEEGRLRLALFQLETFSELVVSHQLVEEANESRRSDAERRTFIAARTGAMRADTQDAWSQFRAKMHGYDAELRSLGSIEKVVYAGDLAVGGMMTLDPYDGVARELPSQEGVPYGYVIALVRAAHTSGLNLGWASDLLTEAVKEEGLPPRVLEEPWANVSAAAVAVPEGDIPPYLRSLAELGDEARRNNETLLSIVFSLAEQRSTRAYGMFEIFGDAASRQKDVIADSARGMNLQLNNTTLELPRSYGLSGVSTSDAIDRARYINEFIEAGRADLGTIISAWSGLEYQRYVVTTLAAVSPIVPSEEPPREEAPSVALPLALVALALVALARRR